MVTASVAAHAADHEQGAWISNIQGSAVLESGITFNPASPDTGLNFGRLFNERANTPVLSQLMLTLKRPVSKQDGYDVGFDLQVVYGSDARFDKYLGELNFWPHSYRQVAFTQADVVVHLPWFTQRGIDVKIGQYFTPLGYEVGNPMLTRLYSHSYIFGYGLPAYHTGVLTKTYIGANAELWLGFDTGESNTLGSGNVAGNAGIIGAEVHLLNHKLTLRAITHMGPEDPGQDGWRFENELFAGYQLTRKLWLGTELNYIRDDPYHANGYGVAQYASYKLSKAWTLNARAEVFRDDSGFFVASFPGYFSFTRLLLGLPNHAIFAPPTTYSEFTLGVTYQPKLPVSFLKMKFRPEIRYDRSLNGTRPYNDGQDSGMLTIAGDLVLQFK